MPNHTTNILYVSGPRASLIKFKDTVSGNNPSVIAHHKKAIEEDIARKTERLNKDKKNTWIQRELNEDIATLKKINDGVYKGKSLDFNGTVPMPSSLNITEPPHTDEEKEIAVDNLQKYGHATWYGWSIANYGTKWGAYDVEDVEDWGDTLIYHFQTAWSPPMQWIITTSKQFPDLVFLISAADEGGVYFIKSTISNGDVTNEVSLSQHEWNMEYDEGYKELYDKVFNSEYEVGIKYVLDRGDIEWSLEEELLNYIKDEDLPLFISFDWYNNRIHEQYNERVRSLNVKKDE